MNVRAQGFIYAAQWLEVTHGREAVALVLARCSPRVRERYMSAIAIEWHPFEEFMELLEAIEASFGRGDGETARQSGAYSAQQATRTMANRLLLYLASPELLLRRVAGVWSQHNDNGSILLHAVDDSSAIIELAGLPKPHPLCCASVRGWVEVIARAVGALGALADHSECRCRGHARCVFAIGWDRARALEVAQRSGRAS